MFTPEQLRDKALLALEEAVLDCRYGAGRRTLAVRFALAYLYAYGGRDRRPFDQLWRILGDPKSPWSFSSADGALLQIYRLLGIERDNDLVMAMWRKRNALEKGV